MSKIRTLIYAIDIHNLQTWTESSPEQEKIVKKVDSGWTCAFYECQY